MSNKETNVEDLRRMNTNMRRSDIENAFLQEMVEEDQADIINEMDDAAIDSIVPDNTDTGMACNASSETIFSDSDNGEDILAGFEFEEIM